ncbi:hypothetical protein GGH94_003368 [Coemansia aciculifera]|uniref:Oxidoreductase-like domain-containing protein n=1 Tax=Coemansia aciculifera TaxID=417176 RepID=A0A9W8IK48_9FUNG|nr:hypothetical protein GGH94_003368 [Coemansia aciculifera]
MTPTMFLSNWRWRLVTVAVHNASPGLPWRRQFSARRFSVLSARPKQLDPEVMMRTLPPKPEPPSNDDCCLSGCEFCVWDLYDEDMREYQKQAAVIRDAFETLNKPVPACIRPESLRDAVDPTMRAFLDMEREMAMRIQQEADKHSDSSEDSN